MSFLKWQTHHTKSPPRVTQFRLQSHTIIHTKIHPHTYVQNKPANKYRHVHFTPIFVYVYHQRAKHFCQNIHKSSSQFLKIWQFGHAVLPNRPDGETLSNLELPVEKYSRILLTFTAVHLFYNILQNDLIPRMHHYLIYYIQTFLRILIFRYLASNIVINSSTSSRVSNMHVTPFYLQFFTTYGLHIKNLAPSSGTTKSNTIGHTDVF